MTIRELMIKKLVSMGMFESQAIQIVNLCETERDETKSMTQRWDDLAEDYPSVLITVLFLSVAVVAYEWIEENIPNAWFKPLFKEYA